MVSGSSSTTVVTKEGSREPPLGKGRTEGRRPETDVRDHDEPNICPVRVEREAEVHRKKEATETQRHRFDIPVVSDILLGGIRYLGVVLNQRRRFCKKVHSGVSVKRPPVHTNPLLRVT